MGFRFRDVDLHELGGLLGARTALDLVERLGHLRLGLALCELAPHSARERGFRVEGSGGYPEKCTPPRSAALAKAGHRTSPLGRARPLGRGTRFKPPLDAFQVYRATVARVQTPAAARGRMVGRKADASGHHTC